MKDGEDPRFNPVTHCNKVYIKWGFIKRVFFLRINKGTLVHTRMNSF